MLGAYGRNNSNKTHIKARIAEHDNHSCDFEREVKTEDACRGKNKNTGSSSKRGGKKMMFELHGTGTVIGKNEESGLLGTKYKVAYEANVDGQRVTGSKKVRFDEYCGLEVGDEIPVKLFSGNGRTATSSRVDAGLESIFGGFLP